MNFVLTQFFKKSFPFQFVDHTFIDKLLDVDFTSGFTVAVAYQLKRIADTVALDPGRKRKLRGEIIVSGVENFRVLLLEAIGVDR